MASVLSTNRRLTNFEKSQKKIRETVFTFELQSARLISFLTKNFHTKFQNFKNPILGILAILIL